MRGAGGSSPSCAPNHPFRLLRCSGRLIVAEQSTGLFSNKRSAFRASPLRGFGQRPAYSLSPKNISARAPQVQCVRPLCTLSPTNHNARLAFFHAKRAFYLFSSAQTALAEVLLRLFQRHAVILIARLVIACDKHIVLPQADRTNVGNRIHRRHGQCDVSTTGTGIFSHWRYLLLAARICVDLRQKPHLDAKDLLTHGCHPTPFRYDHGGPDPPCDHRAWDRD